MADLGVSRRHRLADFKSLGYDKGRSWLWQGLWFATQHLVFGAWWFPASLRPAVLRSFGATVGRGVRVRNGVRVHWPWKLCVGDDTWIGEGAWLLNLEPIDIGNDVCVSQEAFLCTGGHDHSSQTFEFDNGPIVVLDGAWIAAQAMVLRGVTVGANALVGARAVITKSIADGSSVAAGARY